MNAIWSPSPNFSPVAGKRTILGVVIHSTEGGLDASLTTLQRRGGASAHYLIATSGQTYQLVADDNVAYHVAAWGSDPNLNRSSPNWLPPYNGLYSAVNACTLGVELEGFAAQGFTPAQYAELGALIAEKSQEHGFSPTLLPDVGPDARVLTHGWLQTDRSDPGVLFEWETLRTALQAALQGGEMPITPDEQTILDAAARQTAAGNTIANGGDLDWWIGTWQQLAGDKESLVQLLQKAQAERDAAAAEAALLKAQGSGVTVDVTSVTVRLSDGREVVR